MILADLLDHFCVSGLHALISRYLEKLHWKDFKFLAALLPKKVCQFL